MKIFINFPILVISALLLTACSVSTDELSEEINKKVDEEESVHPTLGEQPFGKEASKRNKELLEGGKVITVEFDVGERVDRFGRILGYISVDGVDLSETLIREGLARVAYISPPNTRHLDRYEKAQEQAKKEGIGIWSIENYAEQGFKQ